ncbi:MAG: hypothetical protein U1E67_19920 [Hyphomicrobiales bacterium]
MKQADFFETDHQPDLLGEDAPPRTYSAEPDKVRAKLHRIIAEARAASTVPWDAQRLRHYLTVVPQMSLWLPEDEATQLRLEFELEIKRLEAA